MPLRHFTQNATRFIFDNLGEKYYNAESQRKISIGCTIAHGAKSEEYGCKNNVLYSGNRLKRSNLMIAQIKGAGEKVYHSIARAAILVLVIIACTATTVAAANSIITSYVYCDEEMTKVVSFSSDVDDILNKANVQLQDNDIVDLTSYTDGENDGVIYVYRSCEVSVTDGDKTVLSIPRARLQEQLRLPE